MSGERGRFAWAQKIGLRAHTHTRTHLENANFQLWVFFFGSIRTPNTHARMQPKRLSLDRAFFSFWFKLLQIELACPMRLAFNLLRTPIFSHCVASVKISHLALCGNCRRQSGFSLLLRSRLYPLICS